MTSPHRTAGPSGWPFGSAATLYYLLTGQHIYELAGSMMELLARVLQEEPIPLRPGPPHPALVGQLAPILCYS
jgi:hypothetical protein